MSPITPAIVQFREVLFFGTYPTIFSFGIYLLISIVIAWLGFAWFQKTRNGFADVI
jgi:lipopolysaccharide transport system permease protein